jgi:hypothetical protein
MDRPEGGGARHDQIDKSLRSQLAEIGYRPADITYLAMLCRFDLDRPESRARLYIP